jgi:glutathione S-transferase
VTSTAVLFDLATQQDLRPSPFCWRAKLALTHKGIRFEARATRYLDIRSLGDGSFKTLPVMQHDEKWIGGSMNIADYLESQYADRDSLFPKDPARLYAGFIETWVDSVVQPQIFPMVAYDIWTGLFKVDQQYFRETRELRLGTTLEDARQSHVTQIPVLRKSLEPVRRILKQRPFLCGKAPAFADYIVFGALKWPRLVSSAVLIEAGDPIEDWYLRLDGMGGLSCR